MWYLQNLDDNDILTIFWKRYDNFITILSSHAILIAGHTKANGVAKTASLGCNFTANPVQFDDIQTNQSYFSPNPNPSSTTSAPIHWQTYTNFILIYCQFNVNQVQIHHQSDANHVSMNSLPIICYSSDIPVQIYCQAITNVALLVHCKPISIKF